LDLESVEWLEGFLRNQNIPMVIVSHDREFLDQICTKIVDVEGGIASEYDGNYSKFLQLKKARMDAWTAAYNAQEKRIKEERAWINKFRDKQPVAVKQREAKLEKLMSSKDYVQKPPFIGKPFRFRFPDAPRLSPEVAEIMDLTHGYGNNRLFDKVQLFIGKGDRIAVVGPNGSGKSTLLRFLTGKEQPDGGSAALVGLNVVANYFEQNQADVLDLDLTVSETIQRASNGQSYNELRALLGQFLFKGDAVDKKVGSLSGGEKARLSLCTMMLRPANVLILGELYGTIALPLLSIALFSLHILLIPASLLIYISIDEVMRENYSPLIFYSYPSIRFLIFGHVFLFLLIFVYFAIGNFGYSSPPIIWISLQKRC
jgi:ATPase subunit of ABC transporter with duplicated ATPase domains